ncbi:MAG: hypothetical protein JW751_09870 [Polyangiaceae bacterium]|nr:hypothetical protein [Polyangiaceae bacterium]
MTETPQHLRPAHQPLVGHEIGDGAPERVPTVGGRFAQALHLLLVRAQRQAKHVRDHLPAHPLALKLVYQIEEHPVGDMGEG